MVEVKMKAGSALEFLVLNMRSYLKGIREFLYGMTVHEMHVEFRKEKTHLDHLFMLIVFGDLVGLPLLPPYYSMRLLPYIIPTMNSWKRSILREKDLIDLAKVDI